MPRPSLPESELPELPPLDPQIGSNLGEPDPEAEIELGDLLETGLDESVGLDDELAADIETGIHLTEEESASEEVAGSEIVLDIQSLLERADEKLAVDADEPGLPELDPAIGLEPAPELGTEDAEDSADESLDDLVSGELPGLDADDEGEFGIELVVFGALDSGRDEEPPPWSNERWQELGLDYELEPIAALAVRGSIAIAAGQDLLWFEEGSSAPLRLAAAGARIDSAVLVGGEPPAIVFATAAGQLVRRHRLGSTVELLRGFRDAAAIKPNDPVRLELCQVGDEAPDVLLLRTHSGLLLRSADGGSSFRAVDVGGRVVALPRRAVPCAALVERSGMRWLIRSPDSGQSWQSFELDPIAQDIAQSEAPLITASASVIALGDVSRGMVISSDGGASWDRIRGTSNATALCAGSHDGRLCVWAATYREALDSSEIVLVDAVERRAVRIAQILGAERATASDEPTEFGRVAALEWDAVGRCLWAAGTFGVTRFVPRASVHVGSS